MTGSVLTADQRQLARRLRARGMKLDDIGRQVGASHSSVMVIIQGHISNPGPTYEWAPAGGRLTLADREEITVGLAKGETYTTIAVVLGKATSSVSREVGANGGREDYRAWPAHCRARGRARRPKNPKLACPKLAAQVSEGLLKFWSPEEIARRLRIDFPDDPMMWVSHETIYQSLFVQGRGELRRELARCLRSGRTVRRPRGATKAVGKITGMVMISERPAEVADRAVPGHWEGDLIIGARSASAVGTLVERTTRYLMLLHLPHGHGGEAVKEAMKVAIAGLPAELMRTITWDQGTEMHRHRTFTVETGIQIYFCDPHSPWQRGSNENTNGLLRQYMPKSTNLSVYSAADLAGFAASLNDRPRKTLGFMKPSEKLAEFLALTA